MPYIEKKDRQHFDLHIDAISPDIDTPGELNYIITRLMHKYLDRKTVRYHNLNELIGAIECAKLELYRRIVGPYEDQKIQQYGDIGILEAYEKP